VSLMVHRKCRPFERLCNGNLCLNAIYYIESYSVTLVDTLRQVLLVDLRQYASRVSVRVESDLEVI